MTTNLNLPRVDCLAYSRSNKNKNTYEHHFWLVHVHMITSRIDVP